MGRLLFCLFFCGILFTSVSAEDGRQLWLRMDANAQKADVHLDKGMRRTATMTVAVQELKDYWKGAPVRLRIDSGAPSGGGFTINRSENEIILSSASDVGVLYGVYAMLRMQQTGRDIPVGVNMTEQPSYDLRILNHWDNPDGTVERGYAGRSIWKWDELPRKISPIYIMYARANASVGINGVVLNNVNAKPMMLSEDMLQKVAAIADVLRPYGIRVFLSVNFASPKALGKLASADPLRMDVRKWWQKKVDEIYGLIPDFGGFLVKANSEGEPGPQDYGRTHVDGANMLADVLSPHGGLVMWRAFVYSANNTDRACQAYEEFVPFDGQFRANVLLQVKNGPIDFQPREPFSPLFGAMKHTQLVPELQITQEYLGESIHTVFLPVMWKDCLDTDTYRCGNMTVGEVTRCKVSDSSVTAIAGVANIGDVENWTGSDMAQANWYGFGRVCWDTEMTSDQIAEEFLMQTFSCDSDFVYPMRQLLLRSWSAAVDYMMPLGLHHIFAFGHHYGPEPWCAPEGAREDWLPRYYHRADSVGLGFDRSPSGSNASGQYCEPLSTVYGTLDLCPDEYLLWFHHVPWNYTMRNGLTMWDNLCYAYDRGVKQAMEFVETWKTVAPYVDAERYARQLRRFERQAMDAMWWRDAVLLYFQRYSGCSFPADSPKPVHSLEELMNFKLLMDNYTAADMDLLP